MISFFSNSKTKVAHICWFFSRIWIPHGRLASGKTQNKVRLPKYFQKEIQRNLKINAKYIIKYYRIFWIGKENVSYCHLLKYSQYETTNLFGKILILCEYSLKFNIKRKCIIPQYLLIRAQNNAEGKNTKVLYLKITNDQNIWRKMIWNGKRRRERNWEGRGAWNETETR